eukprot:scaffold92173_cov48-Attheya_sp.AAC.4
MEMMTNRCNSMSWSLENLESTSKRLATSRDVAFERMALLNVSTSDNMNDSSNNGVDALGLSSIFVPLLKEATDAWVDSIKRRLLSYEAMCLKRQETVGSSLEEEKKEEESVQLSSSPGETSIPQESINEKFFLVHETTETKTFHAALHLHLTLARLDPTLGEELGREGSHALISQLVRFDLESETVGRIELQEEDLDQVMELQDIACEIGSLSRGSFPLKYGPFTRDELINRLPLSFVIDPSETLSTAMESESPEEVHRYRQHILINQVTARQSAQEDVGFGKFVFSIRMM